MKVYSNSESNGDESQKKGYREDCANKRVSAPIIELSQPAFIKALPCASMVFSDS